MQNAIAKKLTNVDVVRLAADWRTAQIYHAALRSTNRLRKRGKFSKKRIMKVLLEEFSRAFSERA